MSECPRCGGSVVRAHGRVTCLPCGFDLVDGDDGPGWVEPIVARRRRDLHARAGQPWSRAEQDFLFANKDRLSAAAIGAALGRSERSVHHYLSRIGMKKARRLTWKREQSDNFREPYPGPRKRYTEAEIAEMEDAAAPGAWGRVAQRLGRSVRSVQQAAWVRGISAWEGDGLVSPEQFAFEAHMTARTVRRWCASGALPATRSGRFWRIDREAALDALAKLEER